jgi:hypothetical protein
VCSFSVDKFAATPREVEALRHREMLRAVQQGNTDMDTLDTEPVVIWSPMSFRGTFLRIMELKRLLPQG